MKKTIIALICLATCASVLAAGSHSRKGYVKKSGTYVAPSHATNPNKTKRDNYSHKGNVNPYTGKEGKKN